MATTTKVPSDFLELVSAFDAEGVEYLIVGAYAFGAHVRPRATKDLDIWIAGGENLERVARALARFGLPARYQEMARTLADRDVLWFGAPPVRVDLLRSLEGVEFAAAYARAERFRFGAIESVPFIGLDDLITNKRAVARRQDLADVEHLERARARRPHPKP